MKVVPATVANITAAVKEILAGNLVVMPTETVYGLACDATNPDAVKKIFAAKKRPSDNPLILHISSLEQLQAITTSFDARAKKLADRFWPGPLTLVLRKHPDLNSLVTGGLDTVAVRMPAHPVALSLIKRVGRPLAAPSANPFMGLSPTRVEHLDRRLGRFISLALDGGPSRVGVESAVIDCTEPSVRILRPGSLSRGEIQAALGEPLARPPRSLVRKSPGMYTRHYAPKATVVLAKRLRPDQAGLTFMKPGNPNQIKMPDDARAYMASLYDAMYRLDKLGVDTIVVQSPPSKPEWEAVHDRLAKASALK